MECPCQAELDFSYVGIRLGVSIVLPLNKDFVLTHIPNRWQKCI